MTDRRNLLRLADDCERATGLHATLFPIRDACDALGTDFLTDQRSARQLADALRTKAQNPPQ